LVGALWGPTELTVDPRQIVRSLPRLLAERYGVQFHFNCAVHRIEHLSVQAPSLRVEANAIIVASGDDFQTLFPECFRDSRLTRCFELATVDFSSPGISPSPL
jgi:glycine/D-amino acid oxidase-like deaminating enzyme